MTFQDMTITAKVKAALAQAEDVSAMDIDVNVKNGVVTLKGNVSRDAHDRAIQVARGVDGVVSVEDNLNITSSA
ncbi:MAG TPA: BON domain-containing protein [Armatimonadota bacterium]|nr:BON domain-containing protein [Armatimonadota bacterium]HOP79800.1 BON domain-containing protein [Armatimonadota bacterium]HPP73913.1 BON domain-containing protein [Armatimonadota bacterium]